LAKDVSSKINPEMHGYCSIGGVDTKNGPPIPKQQNKDLFLHTALKQNKEKGNEIKKRRR
jgi:hypothetical protein